MMNDSLPPVPHFIHPFANFQPHHRPSSLSAAAASSSSPSPLRSRRASATSVPSSSALLFARQHRASATATQPQHQQQHDSSTLAPSRTPPSSSNNHSNSNSNSNNEAWVWSVSNADVPSIPAFYPPLAASSFRRLASNTTVEDIARTLSVYARVHSVMASYDTQHARMECTTSSLLKFEIQLWFASESGTDNEPECGSPSENGIVVEVRRLRGCCVELQHTRRALFSLLASAHSMHRSQSQSQSRSCIANVQKRAPSHNQQQQASEESVACTLSTAAETDDDDRHHATAHTFAHSQAGKSLPSQPPSGGVLPLPLPLQLQLNEKVEESTASVVGTAIGTTINVQDELQHCIDLIAEPCHNASASTSPMSKMGPNVQCRQRMGCERLCFLTDPSKTRSEVAVQVATAMLCDCDDHHGDGGDDDGSDDDSDTHHVGSDVGRSLRNALEDCFLQEPTVSWSPSVSMSSSSISSPTSTSIFQAAASKQLSMNALNLMMPVQGRLQRQSSCGRSIQYLALRMLAQSLRLLQSNIVHSKPSPPPPPAATAAQNVSQWSAKVDFRSAFWQTVIQRCWYYLEWCTEGACIAALAATCLRIITEMESGAVNSSKGGGRGDIDCDSTGDGRYDDGSVIEELEEDLRTAYPIILDAIEYGQCHNLCLEEASRQLLDVLDRQRYALIFR